MTDPIEAVARAVFEADEARLAPAFRHHWDNILSQRQEEYRDRAGTAIAAFLDAVREPSEAMVCAAIARPGPDDIHELLYFGVFRAMVDALRAELLPPPGDACDS